MLLILDVDGVMTNGTKPYAQDGSVPFKHFCDLDFTAIKKFKMDGWNVCWLSADTNINQKVAADRGIDFWDSRKQDGTIDKVAMLAEILLHYNEKIENTVYVGDDMFDLPIMKKIQNNGGKAFCPNNASPFVSSYTYSTKLEKEGGNGAIMELYYKYYNNGDTIPCT